MLRRKKIHIDDPVCSTKETILIWEYLLKHGSDIEHFFDRIDCPKKRLLDPSEWIDIRTSVQVMESYRRCIPDYDMTRAFDVALEQFDSYAYGGISLLFRLPPLRVLIHALPLLAAIPSKIERFRILESDRCSAIVEYAIHPGFERYIDSSNIFMWKGVLSAIPRVHDGPQARVRVLATVIDIADRFNRDFKQFGHRLVERNGTFFLDGEPVGRRIRVQTGMALNPILETHMNGHHCVLWEKDVVGGKASGKQITIARRGQLYNCPKTIFQVRWENIPFPMRLKNFYGALRGYFPSKMASKKALFERTRLLSEYSELLKQKVEEKAREVYDAQQEIHKLEKQVMEHRITGGFAHEMRNVLAGAQLEIQAAMNYRNTEASAAGHIGAAVSRLSQTLAAEGGAGQDDLTVIRQAAEHLSEVLAGISHDVERGLSITAKIHEYARIHEIRPGSTPVDIMVLLRQFEQEYGTDFQTHKIEYSVQGPDSLVIPSDEIHMVSVFSNLILNARDALTEVASSSRRISVMVEAGEGSIQISVRDNGPGMSPEVRQEIFHPFFSTKPATGTGLGLGIARRILASYGGTLSVLSEEGRGALCRVEIPVRPLDPETLSRHY